MKEEYCPAPESVQPVRPVAPYIGGKRALSKRLVEMIDAIPHTSYVEPFVGMGGVFLRRTRKPRAEIINDLSGDVSNLFRILQWHYEAFMGELRWKLTSRADFVRLMQTDAASLTDLHRAARFLYLQRLAFGGKVEGRSFGVSKNLPARFDVTKLESMLADVHERLAGVVIESMPYADVIRRYDHPGALFYLDPPYHGCEDDYGKAVFSEDDFRLLSGLLEGLQGRFVLSLNDTPLVRDLFGRFQIEEVPVNYRLSGKVTAAREVIITGQ